MPNTTEEVAELCMALVETLSDIQSSMPNFFSLCEDASESSNSGFLNNAVSEAKAFYKFISSDIGYTALQLWNQIKTGWGQGDPDPLFSDYSGRQIKPSTYYSKYLEGLHTLSSEFALDYFSTPASRPVGYTYHYVGTPTAPASEQALKIQQSFKELLNRRQDIEKTVKLLKANLLEFMKVYLKGYGKSITKYTIVQTSDPYDSDPDISRLTEALRQTLMDVERLLEDSDGYIVDIEDGLIDIEEEDYSYLQDMALTCRTFKARLLNAGMKANHSAIGLGDKIANLLTRAYMDLNELQIKHGLDRLKEAKRLETRLKEELDFTLTHLVPMDY